MNIKINSRKPLYGEIYFYITGSHFLVHEEVWLDLPTDDIRYQSKNCFNNYGDAKLMANHIQIELRDEKIKLQGVEYGS